MTLFRWIQWIPQCDNVYVTQLPVDVAQGTAVPYWAYYDITTLPNQTWNATVAMNIGRNPETKPKPINTVGGSNTVSRTSTGVSGATNTSEPKGGTNVGAIVGGVVGTVVPLTILGVVLFLYTRHRRQRTQQQPQLMGMPSPDDDPYKNRPVSYGIPPMGNVPLAPYNPSDPSTFPPQSPPHSVTYTTPPVNNRGTYAGMPEV